MISKLRTLCRTVRQIVNWPAAVGIRLSPRPGRLRLLSFRSGLSVICRDDTQDWEVVKEVVLDGGYGLLLSHLARLPGEPVVLDLGANIGLFSLQATAAHAKARVFAYEPGPPNLRLLELNRLANPRLADRIHVRPEAVGGQTRAAQFYYDETNPQASTFCYGKGGSISVQIRALSEVLDSLPGPVAVAKIDIEGAEYELIENSPALLWRGISAICLEVHDDPRGSLTPKDLLDQMARHGFHCQPDPLIPSVYFLRRQTAN